MLSGFRRNTLTQCPENRQQATLPYYENVLVMLMAGRAAEQLALGSVSSGSGGSGDSDLARATRMAFEMERTLGFGREFPLLYRPHRDLSTVLDYDRELAARLQAMLENAQEKAEELLRERRSGFDALAKTLFEELAQDERRVDIILSEVNGLHLESNNPSLHVGCNPM